ncbi:PAS domain-containing protein [Parabacteroides sp. OttesenSCG-928-G07]|nr:PAS domain-containing protein [Parabacteroides sp. OttesenSCG-928-G21]MDL2277450.1 PAS domain-containing protein [Parabacteroides sp. OttesenSCG-928-G07]
MKSESDQTKQKEDIEYLRKTFHKVLSILSVHHIGLWEYDAITQKITYLNDFLEVLGLKKIGLDHTHINRLDGYIHPDDLPVFTSAFDQALASDAKNNVIRYRVLGRNNEYLWMEDHFFAPENAGVNGSRKIIGYSIDIDDQVKKEEKINILEMRYNAIVEALPGFVFVFDDKFFLRDVFMPQSMQLFHSMKELIGMDGREIYSPEVCELFIESMQNCLKDGQLREIEYPVYLKDLSFYYQARIVPYGENMVLALIQDIGDRVRRIEELVETRKREESNIMKSAFFANMSHEIRTPLNAIVGFSEILANDDYTENKEEFIEIIRANSELLLQLINDILDISRIESGKIEIVIQQVEINSLLKEVAEVYQIKMLPGVELKLIQPEEKIYTYTDPNRVKQVLYNFLSNAVKHTQKGSITIRLNAEKDNSLTFSVTDTGSGIEQEKLPFLFQRFEKLNNYAKGTGLGLSIAKSLVEHMGGEIMASSVFGEGSTFSFNLPLRETKEEAESAMPDSLRKKKKIDPAHPGQKKILVIEPVDSEYRTIQSTLAKDYALVRAITTDEANTAYLTEVPDLVLINISAPSINSIDLIKRIRTSSSFIPVISLTTHGNYIDQEFAIKAGSNDVVLRPYSASRLQDAIVAYI